MTPPYSEKCSLTIPIVIQNYFTSQSCGISWQKVPYVSHSQLLNSRGTLSHLRVYCAPMFLQVLFVHHIHFRPVPVVLVVLLAARNCHQRKTRNCFFESPVSSWQCFLESDTTQRMVISFLAQQKCSHCVSCSVRLWFWYTEA